MAPGHAVQMEYRRVQYAHSHTDTELLQFHRSLWRLIEAILETPSLCAIDRWLFQRIPAGFRRKSFIGILGSVLRLVEFLWFQAVDQKWESVTSTCRIIVLLYMTRFTWIQFYSHMFRHLRCVFINYNWINQLSNKTIWWLDICCLLHRYEPKHVVDTYVINNIYLTTR
jgi:hypothetical protein